MGEKTPRLTAKEVEAMLFSSGFVLDRQKGSHKIYVKNKYRIVIPYHGQKELHPKIIKEALEVLEAAK